MKEKFYFKAVVSYDGTDYFGWQIQPNALTVQQVLQDSFIRIFKKPALVFGASRTDAGVHAMGQVCKVSTDFKICIKRLLRIWNAGLSRDISILSLEKVDASFHPHAGVELKTYHYKIFLDKPDPFKARFGWRYPFANNLDIELFQKVLTFFVGELDFRHFVKVEDHEKQFKRSLDSIEFKKNNENEILLIFKAKGFYRYQIRRIVGACLEMATRKSFDLFLVKASLSGRVVDPLSLPNLCAEPQGLCLINIKYK